MAAGRTVVMQSYHYKHPTVFFRIADADHLLWSVGDKTLAIPNRPDAPLTYLRMAQTVPLQGAILEKQQQLLEQTNSVVDPAGQDAVQVLRPREGVLQAERSALAVATLGDELDVLDWTLPERARRDKALRILVHWRALRPVDGGRVLSLHLVDVNGVLWTQDSDLGYLSEQWRVGDAAYQLFEIPIPSGIPAGPYEARLLLSREGGAPFPVHQSGRPTGLYFSLGVVTLKTDGRRLEPLTDRGVLSAPEMRAISWESGELRGVPGGHVAAEVTWQAMALPASDYAVTLELVDAQGHVAQKEELPLAAGYPTTKMQAGEVVRVIYPLSLVGVDVGTYSLRLRVSGQDGLLRLGRVIVAGEPRLFEVPAITHPVMAEVGAEITFLGYDLPDVPWRAGSQATVTLYWQALAAPTRDFKVFLHLVDETGRIWAQHDSAPANWARPTRGWVQGEVVEDVHTLDLSRDVPPGTYLLCAGMYDPVTLMRLPVTALPESVMPDERIALSSVTVVR